MRPSLVRVLACQIKLEPKLPARILDVQTIQQKYLMTNARRQRLFVVVEKRKSRHSAS